MTITDPDTALAAIRAAGDDFQSLYEAIKNGEMREKPFFIALRPSPPAPPPFDLSAHPHPNRASASH